MHLIPMRAIAKYFAGMFSIVIIHISCRNDAEFQHQLTPTAFWDKNDSLRFYFPQSGNADSGFLFTKGDKFRENWYSSALFSFKEPILYNKHIEVNIYRFLWLRSFHRPVVFVLSRSGSRVTLTTKILDRQPEFIETKYDPRGWDDLMDELKGKTIQKIGDSLIVVIADRKANIVYNNTSEVTLDSWASFEQLLQKAQFWNMPAVRDNERGMDGSEWILEGLLGDKYHFAVRWTPKGQFRDAGIFLIELSGLKEDIY